MRARPAFHRSQLALLAVALLPFALYSNGYHHAYQLDDAYTVVSNGNIRSLANIPRFFVDPATYTSIREQADYRPLLQATYAINYAVSGYDTASWHFTQVLLHALVTVGVFYLARRILMLIGAARPEPIAVTAAMIFAAHPVNAGVVMYFNARSSLLTAAFLMPALVSWVRAIEEPGYDRPQWMAACFYALALFTKVEAVGAIGAFWAAELWQRAREQPSRSLVQAASASLDRRTWRRLAPVLGITIIYFVIRARVMAPFPFENTRHAPDVGAYEYFITQLTAWWYYVARWLAPVRLVADYLSYPVFRAWYAPTVLLAAGAWLAVGTLLVAAWKRAPWLMFVAIASLALISPTSSIAPLAEMVNEHRPYLPFAVLPLLLVIPAGMTFQRWQSGGGRIALAGSLCVMVGSLSALTYQRNTVFLTAESYWRDVLDKAPSARAHLNYGLALMSRSEMTGAMREYRAALDRAPYWYFTHLNLGVAYAYLGQPDSARAAFDRGVQYDLYSGLALTWRGEFNLAQHEWALARDDFVRAAQVSLDPIRVTTGLATAYAGLADAVLATEATQRLFTLDSTAAIARLSAIAAPFSMDAAHRVAGIEYFRRLALVLGARQWIDLGVARLRTPDAPQVVPAGSNVGAQAEQQRLMGEGLGSLSSGDLRTAESAFRQVLALNPTHYGAHYQLAVTLDRLGRTDEARVLWLRVLKMAMTYGDATTAATARARVNGRR